LRSLATAVFTATLGVIALVSCDPEPPATPSPVPPANAAAPDTWRGAAERWVEVAGPKLIGRRADERLWADRATRASIESIALKLAHSQTGTARTVEHIDHSMKLVMSPEEKAHAIDRLRDDITTVDLRTDMAADPNRTELENLEDDRDWVDAAYPLLLDRPTETGEAEMWVDALDDGVSREGVARTLMLSDEGRQVNVDRIAEDVDI